MAYYWLLNVHKPITDLPIKLGINKHSQHTVWISQVFSNKPDASDKDAVFVIRIDSFLELDCLTFCDGGTRVHTVFSHELVTANF